MKIILKYLIPAVFLVLGFPLYKQLIQPNGFYGYRTIKAYSSSENWYRINRFFGTFLMIAGLLAGLINSAIDRMDKERISNSTIYTFVLIDSMASLTAVLATWMYSKKL